MKKATSILELRKLLKLTQVELAELINVDQSTISSYESDLIEPSMTVWRKFHTLARENGVDLRIFDEI